MELLKCENLTLGYEGRTVAENISFSVNSGDYLCIVGENGSGKTTLIKALLNLHRPLFGVIERPGLDGGIGYLPQQTAVQRDFPASVFEIVISGRLAKRGIRPFYSRADKKEARRCLERLDIAELERKCYRELSGGQQQRVLLARALCAADRLLLLDEPVTGLDPKAAAEMYDIIEELNRAGMAVIMITHDMSALKYATHVLHIGGRFFFGRREEYHIGGDAEC